MSRPAKTRPAKNPAGDDHAGEDREVDRLPLVEGDVPAHEDQLAEDRNSFEGDSRY